MQQTKHIVILTKPEYHKTLCSHTHCHHGMGQTNQVNLVSKPIFLSLSTFFGVEVQLGLDIILVREFQFLEVRSLSAVAPGVQLMPKKGA